MKDKIIKRFHKFYQKEVNRYFLFGVLTTLFHYLFFLLLNSIGIPYKIGNLITLIVVKILAYFVNKWFVFHSKCKNNKELVLEIFKYIGSRLFTMVLDYFGLILLVDYFLVPKLIGKAIILVIVVLVNYFLSKRVVYKKTNEWEFIKKNWFVICIVLFSLFRFLISYNLPSYYLGNLRFDDGLMIHHLSSLLNHKYFGVYNAYTLIKGIVFPYCLLSSKILHLSFSCFFTILYIGSCFYFFWAIQKVCPNKKISIILYLVLLFNPVSYSAELFQRLYVNSISIMELYFFLGTILFLLSSKEDKVVHYLLLGIIMSFMVLTRNDSIWIYPVIIITFMIRFHHNFSSKKIFFILIPFVVLVIYLNFVSFVHYRTYGIYSYNELEYSSFKDVYHKIKEIQSNTNPDKIEITRDMLYQLSDYSLVFGITRDEIDSLYNTLNLTNGEIDNGNIVWFIRNLFYDKYQFHNGREASLYFDKLSNELDQLFSDGVLKRNNKLSSIYLNSISKDGLLSYPKKLGEAIVYTSSYQNVRTFSNDDLRKLNKSSFDRGIGAYYVIYSNYRYSENMIIKNRLFYEIIRIIYIIFTIVGSAFACFYYLKNWKEESILNSFLFIILVSYIVIICGVVYTDVTSFHAIRYRYLSNVYILQSLFILLNIYRYFNDRKEK